MRIKNSLISIKTGKKIYNFKNLILNTYLNKLVIAQLESTIRKIDTNLTFKYVLLKLDIPIKNLSEESQLRVSDFTICLTNGASNIETNISPQKINISYQYKYVNQYTGGSIYDLEKLTDNVNISEYYGRKVTAIGFSCSLDNINNTNIVGAVLNTSNYDIYIQEGQEFIIKRNDIVSTDADFYTNNKQITGPVHLSPNYGEPILKQPKLVDGNGYSWEPLARRTEGRLYSIGIGYSLFNMQKEYIIRSRYRNICKSKYIRNSFYKYRVG